MKSKMAVEKMKLINVIGPINDFDRIVMNYIVNNDIHLEDVMHVFSNVQDLSSFHYSNPYSRIVKKVDATLSMAGLSITADMADPSMTAEEIDIYADQITAMLSTIIKKRDEISENLKTNQNIISQVESIADINIPMGDLFDFKHIKIRFGKMPRESYKKLNQFLSEYYAAFFFKFGEDKEGVYGLYCAPDAISEKIDTLFSSLYFERMHIPEKASGLPREVIKTLSRENAELKSSISELDSDMHLIIEKERNKLLGAAKSIHYLHKAFDVRKYSAHTAESFYIAGWIPKSCEDSLARQFEAEQNITLLFEEPAMAKHLTPPTRLKNNRFIRPFESFVQMYSLPAYNELDPTFLFAFTYSLMFGIMYGDMGHGAMLTLVGLILQTKKMFLGPILKICGIISILFGVFYGSVFGIELEFGFMYKPMARGNIMTTLIAAVALGTVVLGVSMLFNIANGIRQKDGARVFFDANGLAGFVFYWAVVLGVFLSVTGHSVITKWFVTLFVAIPLTLIFFKEPLTRLIARRGKFLPKNKGEFITESFFGLFELVLSYITNTISFIRVGAFALIHAGMMMVVYSLANVQQHSPGNLTTGKIAILVFGNLIVMGLEGLLVAIQVLRLEFYEMFSRYFAGGGKPFNPNSGKTVSNAKR